MVRNLSPSNGLLQLTMSFLQKSTSMALKNGFISKSSMNESQLNTSSISPILFQISPMLNELLLWLLQKQKSFYVKYCKNKGTKSEIRQTSLLHQRENTLRCSNNNDPCKQPYQGKKSCLSISKFLKRSKYLIECASPSFPSSPPKCLPCLPRKECPQSCKPCPLCPSYPKTLAQPPPPSLRTCSLCPPYPKHLPFLSYSGLPSRLCPKSCTLFQKIGAKYLKDVSSSSKSLFNMERNKVRRMFTYPIKIRSIQTQMLQFRGLHSSRILLVKSKSNSGKNCKSMSEICKTTEEHCGNRTCKDKDAECYPEKVKCEPVKHTIKEKKEEQLCPTSCVRGQKCIIIPGKKPAKMVYGRLECPPPKLITPRICPTKVESKHDEPVCTEKRVSSKPKKEICVPPPLPGPPTKPISLCPCPPPLKMHPGPCPCPIQKEEIAIKPNPPCLVKDKYPCYLPSYYCPPKQPCERRPPCNKTKKRKS